MAQLRDEEETKRLEAMQNPADIPEEEKQVLEPEPTATPDARFDEPDIEQQAYLGHVNEVQDEPETDWALIALAFPQYAPTIPNATVGQEEYTPLSPNAQLPDSDPTKLWCVCRGVDDGEMMVMCEEPRCREKWFHFGCVGLVESPGEGEWWCETHGGERGG